MVCECYCDAVGLFRWLVLDAPKISCYSSEALIGDKNIHLSCVIRAKPRLSALFWIIDGNGTALAEGEIINRHWTLVMVSLPAILELNVLCFMYNSDIVFKLQYRFIQCIS